MAAGEPRHGWHPLRMRCNECDGREPNCWACNGTGWRVDTHVVNEGLFADGICIAKVEAFADEGPFYSNAVATTGEHERSGPMDSQADAMDWCEIRAGVRPAAILARHDAPSDDGGATP